MSNAPLCSVLVATPAAEPLTPEGFQLIPANASLQQAIQIMNSNFRRFLVQQSSGRTSQRGQPGTPGQNGQSPKQKNGNWVLQSQPTTKIRVYQILPDGTKNTDNFVDVVRPTKTVMRNAVTGEIITIPGVQGNGA